MTHYDAIAWTLTLVGVLILSAPLWGTRSNAQSFTPPEGSGAPPSTTAGASR
jgi:hypothetical protein